MLNWAELAVALAVGLIVFFDWVPTPLNRNIRDAPVRDRLIGDLVHPGERPSTNGRNRGASELESVLSESSQGFESPILRRET